MSPCNCDSKQETTIIMLSITKCSETTLVLSLVSRWHYTAACHTTLYHTSDSHAGWPSPVPKEASQSSSMGMNFPKNSKNITNSSCIPNIISCLIPNNSTQKEIFFWIVLFLDNLHCHFLIIAFFFFWHSLKLCLVIHSRFSLWIEYQTSLF